MSSPVLHWPSTPSPFASSPTPILPDPASPLTTPKSSPLCAAEPRRRRAQYKSRTPSTPLPSRRVSGPSRLATSSAHSGGASSLTSPVYSTTPLFQHPPHSHPRAHAPTLHRRTLSAESPQRTFLRERFIARCLERVRNDRARAVQTRRRAKSCGLSSDGSSDGPDDVFMDYEDADEEEDEDDETVMQDELFRRIMENAQRRRQHDYRISYALEVGSSVDPDMEDVDRWEKELREPPATDSSEPDFVPEDIDEQDLEDYAALADFADLDEFADELFTWSDMDDDTLTNNAHPPPSSSPSVTLHRYENGDPTGGTDVDMS